MELVHESEAFRGQCDQLRGRGTLGLVPTMGALHAGHMALVEEARRQGAASVALTIFVNPLQFGPNEDFARYPRTLEADLEKCREAGVDLVFAPSREAIYPAGFSVSVRVAGLTELLEGVHRPNHFDGVTTIVAKLFALAGPCVAVFGRKDYQQWKVVERMALDLGLPVRVHGMPTLREPDGLAMSSRNRYLSAEERDRALSIGEGLSAAHRAFEGGERSAKILRRIALGPISDCFDSIDYLEVVDPESLKELVEVGERALIVLAARLGDTRLIDNTVLGLDRSPR